MKYYIINGPNINMLGIREPDIYGTETYETLTDTVKKYGEENGIEVCVYQSNHEGCLIDKIQEAYFEKADGIVINPGGYTHTSIALLDAVKATSLPTVEVHISKLQSREDYRQVSYIREACVKTISGYGIKGYIMAMDYLTKEYKK